MGRQFSARRTTGLVRLVLRAIHRIAAEPWPIHDRWEHRFATFLGTLHLACELSC